jgi:hypothetical protein
MPTWLSDPSNATYLILVIFAVVAGVLWARNRDRRSLVVLLVAAALFGLVFVCDRLWESPREEAVRKVREISEAVNARDANKLLADVSDSFRYHNAKKADLRKLIDLARQYNVRTAVWDFDRSRVETLSPTEIDIVFDAKAELPGGAPFLRHFKARFVKDSDGQWRVQTFTPYNIARQERGGEEAIPRFPSP